MSDPEWRQKLIDEYDTGSGPTLGGGQEDAVTPGAGDGIHTMVLEEPMLAKNKKYEGMLLGEIAKDQGKHVVEALLDMTLEEDMKTEWKSSPKPTPLQSLKEIATSPFTIPGLSDGGAHAKFNPGNFFTTSFITECTRKHGMMDLEECHWKLSKYPAQAAGLLDRGHLAEGMPADIVIYDYENLHLTKPDKAFDFPGGDWRRICRAEGYHYTMVNGVITFEGQDCTGETPGRLLRHGSAAASPVHSVAPLSSNL